MMNYLPNRFNILFQSIDLSSLLDLIKVLVLPVLVSLLGSVWLNTLALMASIYIVYVIYEEKQKSLFELSKARATFIVQMPMYFILSVWGLGLAVISDSVARVGIFLVSEMAFLLFVSLLPLYRKNKNWEIKKARFSYKNIYMITAGLMLIHQIIVLIEYA